MRLNTENRAILLLISMLVLVPLACNAPGASQPTPSIQDSAAQTVAAQLTNAAQPPDSATDIPAQPTEQAPVNTEAPPTTAPPTATPCTNKARFISDITIPDDTYFDPGDSFVKTWRIQNVGTCTWDSSYSLVFSSGNIMGASSSVPLTSSVPPNANADVSATMTAPASNGTHQGNWKMRSPDGTVFGFGVSGGDSSIYVRIIVGPTPTPGPQSATFSPSSDGSARSNSSTDNAPVAGDTSGNLSSQAFLTFDISSIPDDATIQRVTLDLGNAPTLKGDPFGDLGCLRVYPDSYGSIGGSDYTPPPVSGSGWRFCSENQMDENDIQEGNSLSLDALENSLAGNNYQLRIQFNEMETDSDGTEDSVDFASVKLRITYIED